MDDRRARQDDKVNKLLLPSIHLELPGSAPSVAEPVLHISFPGLQNTAPGVTHVPFHLSPNMGENRGDDGGNKEETWGEATGGLIFDPEGKVIGKLGEGRFAVQDPGVKVALEPEWIKDLKEGQFVQVRGRNMVVVDTEGKVIVIHPPHSDLITIPARKINGSLQWGVKEFPEWVRKERDGLNYKILCDVRVEVNDLVVRIRDDYTRNYRLGIDHRLRDLDGPFKVIAIDLHSRSLKLALPKGSKANEWQRVDDFTPVRMNDESRPIVIAQDTGNGPYPIHGLLKLPLVSYYCPVSYFPAEHTRVVDKVPHLVFGRRIIPNGHPPYDRNIPHRARYLFKYGWWPSEDQDWAPNSSKSGAVVAEYNRQNHRLIYVGNIEDDPGFE